MNLEDFIIESNNIEGEKTFGLELAIYEWWLANDLSESNLKEFHKRLCDVRGQLTKSQRGTYRKCEVFIAGLRKDAERVVADMHELFSDEGHNYSTPLLFHKRYEFIHPFVDLNGRTGRAIWLHQMLQKQDVPLGFLHTWYYQSLS